MGLNRRRIWIYKPGSWAFGKPFYRGGDEFDRHTLCVGFGGWSPVLVIASKHSCDGYKCGWPGSDWAGREWLPSWPRVAKVNQIIRDTSERDQ